jgi:hypothetical protein
MTEQQITIEKIAVQRMTVPIVGTTPLIVHNFSEKSKRQMLDAQQGRKNVKVARDPEAEYEAAFYRIAREGQPDGYGVPAVAFKQATISAARFYKSVKMSELKQALFFRGLLTKADPQQLVEIHGEPEMREDVVRLGGIGRSADLRYRPEFREWRAELEIEFVASLLSEDSVLSLLGAGGLGVGVCEWRPEKGGDFGRYEIDPDREVTVIAK